MGRLGKARRAIDAMRLPKTPRAHYLRLACHIPCCVPAPQEPRTTSARVAVSSSPPSAFAVHAHAVCSQHASSATSEGMEKNADASFNAAKTIEPCRHKGFLPQRLRSQSYVPAHCSCQSRFP